MNWIALRLRVLVAWLPHLCLFSGFVSSSSALARDTGSDNIDHLVPIDGIVEPAYLKLLSRKLYLTPTNFVRVTVLPSAASTGETALSFYSKPGSGEDVVLTCTRAERNLWAAASNIDPTLGREPAVSVQRLAVPFSRTLARSMSEVIKQMIYQSRDATGTDRIIIDGTDILFSVEDHGGRILRARLAPESEGKKSAILHRITELLRDYCESIPVDRSALTRSIKTEVEDLTREASKD